MSRTQKWGWFGAVGVMLVCAMASRAEGPSGETREFVISVDGKRAGEYLLTIRPENGGFVVTGQADVRVRYLGLYTYVYTYRGTEVWKNGRLQRLESTTVDDRKRHAVVAWVDGNALRIRGDGKERTSRPDVWTSTYWHLAEARFRNQSVPLIDVDTGKDIAARLQYIDTSSINVAGIVQKCAHYRVTGGVQIDLWYDSQERLVRQESMEEGHRTVLELTRLSR